MKIKHLLLAAVSFCVLHTTAVAQSTPATPPAGQIPVETLFRKPLYSNLQFSPNQKFIAATAPINNRQNLVVLDLENRKAATLTSLSDSDVTSVFWANDNRLLFTTGDIAGFETRGDGGLFGIDRDGKNARTLVQPIRATGAFVLRLTSILGRVRGSEDEILVSANDRTEDSQDLYRMNVNTGRKTLVTATSPGKVVRWVLDSDLRPRAAFSMDMKERKWWFSYRSDENSPWRTVAQWNEQLKDIVLPVRFDPFGSNPGDMYVTSNIGRNTMAFFKFNAETGKLGELIYGDDRYDMSTMALLGRGLGEGGSIITSARAIGEKGRILGVSFSGARPTTVWFDEDAKRMQAMLDQALPGRVNSFSPNERRGLVFSYSDTDPGSYYIFDQDKKTLEDTGIRAYPWIDPKQMAPMRYVEWTSVDGMKIGGYLTLPLSYKTGDRVPFIIHPHGGPWAKDNWGFNREVQFMANRGFAVLQPNFRGSTGYGRQHLISSYKEWGGKMIDDMITGVEWAIKEGIADPNRIAAYGASYGGYSTLMLLGRRPDLFKWGVNYVGVTDMEVHQDTQPAQRGSFGELAKLINGDQRADRALFEAQSPTRLVPKMTAPVFHAYGGEDRNVDFANGRVIRAAFERANKPFEWMFVADEAHGYRVDKNVFEFYNRFDAFMKKNTPPAK